jgi:phytoene desaturase
MPDLFEEFFQSIGEDIHQYLDLKKLSPSYKVFYPDLKSVDNAAFESMDVYADIDRMAQQFEDLEK